jgi:FKBP-type peptidyl-prolyl cis-trans isomerase 2
LKGVILEKANTGNKVSVHYTGHLTDGYIFDSSEGREPLSFTLGENSVISGFEEAVVGMEPGEKKTVTIPPEKGYGKKRDDLVAKMNRDQIPEHIEPKEGMQLGLKTKDGREIPVRITELDEEKVILDANHELAGKTLIFDLELVEVK